MIQRIATTTKTQQRQIETYIKTIVESISDEQQGLLSKQILFVIKRHVLRTTDVTQAMVESVLEASEDWSSDSTMIQSKITCMGIVLRRFRKIADYHSMASMLSRGFLTPEVGNI